MGLYCPICDEKVEQEEGYDSIFRCPNCRSIGNYDDFIQKD